MDGESARDPSFQLPWWLEGDHTCEACLQPYVRETGFRCGHCNHPICPLCIVVVRETGEVLCPGCAQEAEQP